MSKKTTRKALFGSVLALVLCVALLIGSTFAWFTDSVSTTGNSIQSGTLDVDLVDAEGNSLAGQTLKFVDQDENILWEPGCTYELPEVYVVNKGSLALKYDLIINGITGDAKLLEAIEWTVTVGETTTELDKLNGNLLPNATTEAIVLSGHMKEEAGNEYQGLTIEGISISVVATQDTVEYDSFNNTYDKGAPWTGEVAEVPQPDNNGVITIDTAGKLAAFAASVNSGNPYTGETIKLGANIDLNDIAWTPIGTTSNPFNGNFYGEGYTISNLYVQGGSWVGLFGYVKNAAHIEGVTIDGATVSGNDYVGAVLGGGYLAENCVKNCVVKNANITATPYLLSDGKYDGGAKAGAVVGYAINGNISGNSAINCSVTAYRDLGSIAGMVSGENWGVTVSGNKADTVTLTYLDLNGAAYDGNKVNENMGDIVGRISNTTIADDNTAKDVTRETNIFWNDAGITYTKNVDSGVVTLTGVTDAYTSETLTVPAGVNALGYKSLQGNTTIKEVTIPSGLTDFGGTPNGDKAANGGFFYKSAVEKITLPEGLTEIPAGAFNQAANLKEVNIPSTVTTIGIGAFGGTGLTELTIPATVTTIGGGAFRDMANLTTVTIEGNSVHIPDYAFRSCANLTTVYLNVNTLTLGTNMIFTNTGTNNENPNNITIYVTNDSVYNTLNATAQVKCTIVKYSTVAPTEDLKEAITNNAAVVLADGEYTLPSLANNEGVTIIGTEGTVIGGEDASTGFGSNFGKNTTIKNVTFSGSTNGVRWSYANGGTSTFENCTFAGDSTYGFHIDSSNGATFIFNNCTFKGFNAFAGDLEKVIFNNCTFLSNGNYGHTNIHSIAYFNNCIWGDNTSVSPAKTTAKLYFNEVDESYHHEYIGSAESLFAFAESVNAGGDSWTGQKVLLVSDIDLNNAAWTPIGQTGATEFRGIFDGNGYTISNLTIDSSAQTGANYSSGLFGWAEAGVTIQNVKVDGATVTGNHNVAVIVGYTYSATISNCHVTNANIVCKHANDDACGDKCGIIGGYVGDEARISDCSVADCTVTAGRDAGQLIGCGYNVSVFNCSATNVTVSATGDCAEEANINNAIIGRVMG